MYNSNNKSLYTVFNFQILFYSSSIRVPNHFLNTSSLSLSSRESLAGPGVVSELFSGGLREVSGRSPRGSLGCPGDTWDSPGYPWGYPGVSWLIPGGSPGNPRRIPGGFPGSPTEVSKWTLGVPGRSPGGP